MGYFGGKFDLIVQRLVEIWSNIPFLYIVIIVASILRPTFGILLGIFVVFSWTNMTYYMRTATYREKERDYTAAARVLGAEHAAHHLHPHHAEHDLHDRDLHALHDRRRRSRPSPRSTSSGSACRRRRLSWGELLKRGLDNLNCPWIVTSAFGGLVIVLILSHLHRRGDPRSVRPQKIHDL